MKIYLAPLEGITGWIYRDAVAQCFGGFDKYFIPFISPNQMGHFSAREKKDILPAHNEGVKAVPQILTNRAEDFVRTASRLEQYGYNEVNLNLGCPSKTVVTKKRGAGFLADPQRLECFLDEIFDRCSVKISVKTRLGMEDAREFEQLLRLFNRYPMEELIVHPRVQKDFYKNALNMEAFEFAVEESSNPLCYNGDLVSVSDISTLKIRIPSIECIMIGRGVLSDPAFGRKLAGGAETDKAQLRRFHDLIYEGYRREMSGERPVLHKMKEIWFYLSDIFEESGAYWKHIKKAQRCEAYERAVEGMFRECSLRKR